MHGTIKHILAQKGSEVVSANVSLTLVECARLMADKKIGSLVVLENDKVVGILHERDVSRVAVTQAMDLTKTQVTAIMVEKIPVVGPDTPILSALAIISEKRVRHLPVVKDDELLGLISIGDITKWLLDSQQQDIHDLISYIQGDFNVFIHNK